MKENVAQKLTDYFKKHTTIAFAYLFGSHARGTATSESDVDIGVYFISLGSELEWETDREYSGEEVIWTDLERIVGKKVDMVVLNRASSTVAYDAIERGVPIFVRDTKLLTRFYLSVSMAADDMREFSADFSAIRARSRSLIAVDKDRLLRIAAFLETELDYFGVFKKVTQTEYQRDISMKRNMERWAENIVNASIDGAKILLASEKKPIPETYRTILADLTALPGFEHTRAEELAQFAKMRNLLAHEYLDIRFNQLKKFAAEGEETYRYLVGYIRQKIA